MTIKRTSFRMPDWRQSWNSSRGSNSSEPPKFLRTAWISWLLVRYKSVVWPSAWCFFLTTQYSILIRLELKVLEVAAQSHDISLAQHGLCSYANNEYPYFLQTTTVPSATSSADTWLGTNWHVLRVDILTIYIILMSHYLPIPFHQVYIYTVL